VYLNFKAGLFLPGSNASSQFDVDDSVTVLISTNCGQNWKKLSKLGASTVPALTNSYQVYSVSLADYANKEIRIAFRSKEGTRADFTSELFIDDIEFTTSLINDASSVSIVFPTNVLEKDSTYSVKVKVTNSGLNPLTNVPVNIKLGSFAPAGVVVPLINPGQFISVQFNNFTPASSGVFTGYAYTTSSGDQNPLNDTVYQSYTIYSNTAIDDIISVASMQMFPNPAQGWVEFRSSDRSTEAFSVSFFDISGKVVLSQKVRLENENGRDLLQALLDCVYNVRILDAKGTSNRLLMVSR